MLTRFTKCNTAIVLCLCFMVFWNAPTALAASSAPSPITVTINGSPVNFDQPPVIQNGRTLVPVSAIFKALGATVEWNDKTKTVTAKKGNTTVVLTVGSKTMTKNGTAITLDVPATIVNGRTLVPAKAVSEAFGAQVSWDEASKTVQITTDAPAVSGPASTLQPWGKDASDFTVGGLTLNKTTYGEFKAQYGSQILSEFGEDGMYHSKYVEIKNGILMFVKFEYDTPDKDMVLYYIDMQGAGVQGPRGIQIGDTVEQALAKFPAIIDRSLLDNYPYQGYDTSYDIYLLLDEQDTDLYYQALTIDGDLVFVHYLPDSDFGAFFGLTIENNKVTGIQLDYY